MRKKPVVNYANKGTPSSYPTLNLCSLSKCLQSCLVSYMPNAPPQTGTLGTDQKNKYTSAERYSKLNQWAGEAPKESLSHSSSSVSSALYSVWCICFEMQLIYEHAASAPRWGDRVVLLHFFISADHITLHFNM